ncbi:ATP-binding protein [uncultured Dokdonia sp.]|uniref:ATP-binding protein n=1 Tax=uncultured Dokdonia sp. TaxID=575653 RepID=UPI00263324C5|nr:ATP-binding protein [uncultured Dokdonia sp.]
MLDKLRQEFLENTTQILILDSTNRVLETDNSLFYIKKDSDITDFHPFFHVISSLFDDDRKEQKFYCVQMEVKGKTCFYDIRTVVHFEKKQVVLFVEDLTDHYKTVHQIKQVRNESIINFNITQELNHELNVQRGFKNKFLANVSHEIRTPLNSILGFLSVLENTNLDREQLDLIGIIKDSSKNLVSIVDDLLDISKIEAGRLEIKNKRFNFRRFTESLIKTYELQAEEKRLKFVSDIGTNLPRFLIGDQLRLNQILINLLENALKFTHQGTVTLRVSTNSRNMRRIPVTFEIIDTGIGIPKEHLTTIFESFTQLEKRGLFGGSGLGLSIVKQLTQLMESDLEVQSMEGEGSTFKFTIFMGVSHDQKEEKEISRIKKSEKRIGGSKKRKYRILLGEDIEVNQLLMMRLFADEGSYSLDIAKNGEQVVLFLEKYQYDLVLMDLSMPIMDGYDAAMRIRNHSDKKIKKIPIIALTARTTEEERDAAKESGMNAYLTKPINAEILFKTIDRLLHRYKNKKKEEVKE